MGGRRCEEAPRRRDTMENYSELQSPYQCCSNGVIDGSMRELQDLYDIMMFSEIIL
jgi:hypothetical protein